MRSRYSRGAGDQPTGAVYSFDPSSGAVSTLFDFTGKKGGTNPVGAIGSKSGTVYGMTA